jgi:hypothetical protein
MSNIIRQIMALFDVEATEQRGHRTKKTLRLILRWRERETAHRGRQWASKVLPMSSE